jgi:hypothetical protein
VKGCRAQLGDCVGRGVGWEISTKLVGLCALCSGVLHSIWVASFVVSLFFCRSLFIRMDFLVGCKVNTSSSMYF